MIEHGKKLAKIIPKHTCYIEVCDSDLSLILYKQQSKVNVYNDFYHGYSCLFSTLRFKSMFEKFYDLLPIVNVYSSDVLNRGLRYTYEMHLKSAIRYCLTARAFDLNVDESEKQIFERVKKLHEAFIDVELECRLYDKLFEDRDGKESLFYINITSELWTNWYLDMWRLILSNCMGKFILVCSRTIDKFDVFNKVSIDIPYKVFTNYEVGYYDK